MQGGVLAGVLVLFVLTSGCKPTDGSVYVPGSYSVRESGVRLRGGAEACQTEPGTGNCPDVLDGLEVGDNLYPVCQLRGQLVGENRWWVYVDAPGGNRGWVASWYLTCPTNRLPEVDLCTAEEFD